MQFQIPAGENVLYRGGGDPKARKATKWSLILGVFFIAIAAAVPYFLVILIFGSVGILLLALALGLFVMTRGVLKSEAVAVTDKALYVKGTRIPLDQISDIGVTQDSTAVPTPGGGFVYYSTFTVTTRDGSKVQFRYQKPNQLKAALSRAMGSNGGVALGLQRRPRCAIDVPFALQPIRSWKRRSSRIHLDARQPSHRISPP